MACWITAGLCHFIYLNLLTSTEIGVIIVAYKKRIQKGWKQIPPFDYEEDYILASIEEKVTNLIFPKIKELGYELYDVEYAKEGKDYFLRVFIDSDNRNRFK